MAEERQEGGKPAILLVDDHPANLVALEAILEGEGYELVRATSGPRALALARERPFAVILLDVRMPGMDGLEVAARLRECPRTRSTPIVFVTASAVDSSDLRKAWAVHATDFLAKPLDPDHVRAKVAVLVELWSEAQRARELAARQPPEEGAREPESFRAAVRSLTDALPAMVFVAGPDGTILTWNQRFYDYTGFPTGNGSAWMAALHPDDREPCSAAYRWAVDHGQPFEGTFRIWRAEDRTFRHHLFRAVPERGTDGRIVGWVGTETDIDEMERARAAERDARASAVAAADENARLFRLAREALDAREQFLSAVSHELRTPLTALKLQLRLLREDLEAVAPDARRALRRVDRAEEIARRVSRRYDDFLETAELLHGKLYLEKEPVDLAAVAREAVRRLASLLARSGCELTLDAPEPVVGQWDRPRLVKTVEILVANAAKFGAGKPVELSVRRDEEQAVLTVRDHGIGVRREDLQRIFEPYERAVPPTHFGGLGLGLFAARKIAEAHGGTLVALVPRGAGAEFELALPLGERAVVDATARGGEALSGERPEAP